ncbi:AAEL009015-PA [Aedes aegypti]|uniref:AAEL009015-PA n=1 Tax=Aedes aegypti TaxID=7159 RepID=Q16X22_AEDAE|nr:AAEL009015-PA [Aedes aegypti]
MTKPTSVENPKQDTKDYRKPDWTDKLCPGDTVYYKNFRTTDIRRWLEAKFQKRVSSHTFQISVGGRVYLAHRNQLKQAGNDKSRLYVTFSRGKEYGRSRKRTREDDEESDSDDAEDFYGFPADSFVFRDNCENPFNDSRDGSGEVVAGSMSPEELDCGVPDRGVSQAVEVDPLEGPSSRCSSSSDRENASLRCSRRIKRFRRDSKYVYY